MKRLIWVIAVADNIHYEWYQSKIRSIREWPGGSGLFYPHVPFVEKSADGQTPVKYWRFE
jgi:hypothetical protein